MAFKHLRLLKVQAVEGQEGSKSRDQQGLLRSQEGGKSIRRKKMTKLFDFSAIESLTTVLTS